MSTLAVPACRLISTHTPLTRRDSVPRLMQLLRQFLLTRLSRGVTDANKIPAPTATFLLTRLSRGVTEPTVPCEVKRTFLLTRLSRGVTRTAGDFSANTIFLLTRLSRGVTEFLEP